MKKRARTEFSASEIKQQVRFKNMYMSADAQVGGFWVDPKGKAIGPLNFILPLGFGHENLFEGIREQALGYFATRGIPWHGGTECLPSGHLLDSQVCCVNLLYPFVTEPEALLTLLRRVYPTAADVLELAEGESTLAFEWIGNVDHLGEWPKEQPPTRGAGVTSADAAVRFRHHDGRVQLVLIEWKYTESYAPSEDYGPKELPYAGWEGKKRLARRYRDILDSPDGPIDSLAVDFEDLFFEPLYQLMRQQMLAHEMEACHELGADLVTVLHVSPAGNEALKFVTPERLRLRYPDSPLTSVWSTLVRPCPGCVPRFNAISVGELFRPLEARISPLTEDWWDYVTTRYSGALLA